MMRSYPCSRRVMKEYMYLEKEETARSFLKQKYKQLGLPHSERDAYKNIFPFTTYIRQALSLFRSANEQDLWSKPLLLYYGMMSLAKAWILTVQPDYPQSASVLRHGLSTRKRKKERFRLIHDEVRVQREGLFPLMAEKLGCPVESGTVYTAQELVAMLPDLADDYRRITGEPRWIPISFFEHESRPGSARSGTFVMPEHVLDRFHLTPAAFANRLNAPVQNLISFRFLAPEGQRNLRFAWETAVDSQTASSRPIPFEHPWFSVNKTGDHYLWLGNHRPFYPLPELLAQWMLLFMLSMLCRYDPPLWGEIMIDHVYAEKTLIEELLLTVEERFPAIVLDKIYSLDSNSLSAWGSSSSEGTLAIVDTSSPSSVINFTP